MSGDPMEILRDWMAVALRSGSLYHAANRRLDPFMDDCIEDAQKALDALFAHARERGATHIDLSDGSLVRARYKSTHYFDGGFEAGFVFDPVEADR